MTLLTYTNFGMVSDRQGKTDIFQKLPVEKKKKELRTDFSPCSDFMVNQSNDVEK